MDLPVSSLNSSTLLNFVPDNENAVIDAIEFN
jgi:hypothetical protein